MRVEVLRGRLAQTAAHCYAKHHAIYGPPRVRRAMRVVTHDGLVGYSFCSLDDEFDWHRGVRIALGRARKAAKSCIRGTLANV